MIRLDMKNYNIILIKKQLRHQLYHQAKLVSMNISLVKKYYHLINKKIIEQAKFTSSLLGKAFEKQIKTIKDQGEKQQVKVLIDLKPKEQTKVIEGKSSDKNNQSTISNVFNDIIKKR